MTSPPAAASPAAWNDRRLLQALRAGDESAFACLLDRYRGLMLRVALIHVPNLAVAEEVVQETWLAVLEGLDRFQARSSLRTWIFGILLNQARSSSRREGRAAPFSIMASVQEPTAEPAVAPERFRSLDALVRPGHWVLPPRPWGDTPEERVLAGELWGRLRAAVRALPASQREVLALRDLEGWSATEVCELLEISNGHERVLLHRARSAVRGALERYFDEAGG